MKFLVPEEKGNKIKEAIKNVLAERKLKVRGLA
jgi:hypothetical protein